LGAGASYSGIQVNCWTCQGNAMVYYASPDCFNLAGLIQAMGSSKFDVVYLNSFFSFSASISIYLGWRVGKLRDARILIAPRGEFSEGALALKSFKKKVFLAGSKLMRLYKDIHWHASTEHEAADILKVFPGVSSKIHVAADLVSIKHDSFSEDDEVNNSDGLQIVFVSRISPMKNLDGLLDILGQVKSKVKLSIFGPIEDEKYWHQCLAMIAVMPDNIRIEYCGALEPDNVSREFSKYHLFAFPTHGENFGHVIFESLRAGTPVLLSDQTPWRQQPDGAVTVVSLKSKAKWVEAIESAASRSADQHKQARSAAIKFAKQYIADSDDTAANIKMFRIVSGLNF